MKFFEMGGGKPTDEGLWETIIYKFYKWKSFRKIPANVDLSWEYQGIIKHFGNIVIVKVASKSSVRPAVVTKKTEDC